MHCSKYQEAHQKHSSMIQYYHKHSHSMNLHQAKWYQHKIACFWVYSLKKDTVLLNWKFLNVVMHNAPILCFLDDGIFLIRVIFLGFEDGLLIFDDAVFI